MRGGGAGVHQHLLHEVLGVAVEVLVAHDDARYGHVVEVGDVRLPHGGEVLVEGELPLEVLDVLGEHVLRVLRAEHALVRVHGVAYQHEDDIRSFAEHWACILGGLVRLDQHGVLVLAHADLAALLDVVRRREHGLVLRVQRNPTAQRGERARPRIELQPNPHVSGLCHPLRARFPQLAQVQLARSWQSWEVHAQKFSVLRNNRVGISESDIIMGQVIRSDTLDNIVDHQPNSFRARELCGVVRRIARHIDRHFRKHLRLCCGIGGHLSLTHLHHRSSVGVGKLGVLLSHCQKLFLHFLHLLLVRIQCSLLDHLECVLRLVQGRLHRNLQELSPRVRRYRIFTLVGTWYYWVGQRLPSFHEADAISWDEVKAQAFAAVGRDLSEGESIARNCL
mmetsp:Transcript_12351/g.25942  ORF Transcript_12351/g.25942 Transcript_12351/m.25942 type:complete len:393 (-) Transcript_12351:99-1277(-)